MFLRLKHITPYVPLSNEIYGVNYIYANVIVAHFNYKLITYYILNPM